MKKTWKSPKKSSTTHVVAGGWIVNRKIADDFPHLKTSARAWVLYDKGGNYLGHYQTLAEAKGVAESFR